jgi:catechol 2,3-dioxygenase-like lactoylglutathione lyase family enzyme
VKREEGVPRLKALTRRVGGTAYGASAFVLPLFTEVRGRGFLRTSPLGGSRKLGDAKEHVADTLSMRWLMPGAETQRKEATMVLSNYKVGAGLAVSDMDRAREFYEGKLGLRVSIDSPDNVQYRCAEDSVLHIYLSPEHAGKSTATLASWGVDDIERVVEELTRRGVTFEQYDEPGLKTDEKGIATFEGDAKVAYFKDPDGHTLSIAQAPRS